LVHLAGVLWRLVGMWRGFEDMVAFGWTDKMPRMVAAEVYGSLATAISQDADVPPEMPKAFDTVAVSIGAVQGTYQALDIVRRSKGAAIQIGNEDMMRWQSTLACEEGLYVEPSSAAGLVAVEKLSKATQLGADDLVVSLLTASGLKDPSATAKLQGEPIVVPSHLETAKQILTASGIFPGSR
jgi:threonine synthase